MEAFHLGSLAPPEGETSPSIRDLLLRLSIRLGTLRQAGRDENANTLRALEYLLYIDASSNSEQ